MDRKRPFERLLKIDHLLQLRKPHAVSKHELLRRCNVSERTLKSDISYMRDIMDAPIKYYRREKGYHYYESYDIAMHLAVPQKEIQQMRLGLQITERIEDNDTLKNIFKTYTKLEIQQKNTYAKHIYFETVPYYQGSELVSLFLEAIEHKKAVQLEYQSYKAASKVKRILQPYFLKEFANRWFVIGNLPAFDTLTTYGLDRIQINESLKILEDTFEIPTNFNPEKYFQFTYGMTVFTDQPVQEVILSFSILQGKYFKSKPFHPYEIIKENNEELIVKMYLIPNLELIRKLASFGSNVKILQPIKLIQEITQFFQKALNQYT